MKTEYDGMKILSTVLRENGITRRGEILDFIKDAELITLSSRKPIDSKQVQFYYGDSNSCFRIENGRTAYASEILVVNEGSVIDPASRIITTNKRMNLLRLDSRKGPTIVL